MRLFLVPALWCTHSGSVRNCKSSLGTPRCFWMLGIPFADQLKSFKWEPDDDGISSSGQAEFDEISAAKAAVDKYDGMDMGLGTALSFESL